MLEVFDNDPNAPHNKEEEVECKFCLTLTESDNGYCNVQCYKADNSDRV